MFEHTRRSWMVTIGQAAAGLRIAGRMQGDTMEAIPLPAGLYLPSQEHLSHALMSAERFHPIPRGCPTDYIRPRNGPFEPLFFSEAEFQVVQRVTKLLLGEPSEAGQDGVEQEVAEWIDLRVASAGGAHEAALHLDPLYRALAEAYDAGQMERMEKLDPVKICREGLEWISSEAQSRHAGSFLGLRTEQQIELLDSISDERADKQKETAGTRFFGYMKGEVIRGFYTSRAGLKELDYRGNAFYARSPGCAK